jgi:hypothetical protein
MLSPIFNATKSRMSKYPSIKKSPHLNNYKPIGYKSQQIFKYIFKSKKSVEIHTLFYQNTFKTTSSANMNASALMIIQRTYRSLMHRESGIIDSWERLSFTSW